MARLPLHTEPQGVEGRQEQQGEQRANTDAANQHVCQCPPKHRVGERDEGQHRGRRRQNDRPGAPDGRFDDGIVVRQARRLIVMDLVHEDQSVAHQDARQRDQAEDRVEAEGLVEDQQGRRGPDETERGGREHHEHGGK